MQQGTCQISKSQLQLCKRYVRKLESYGTIHFLTDVLKLADRKCSGQSDCEIEIPDEDFTAMNPCNKELKEYLEASYSCVKVKSTVIRSLLH